MNDFHPMQALRRNSSQFRLIAFSLSTFSLIFLSFMLFIAQQRPPEPEMFPLIYLGVAIAIVQVPLSFYIWRYIPQRIPARLSKQVLVTAFRMTLIIALLLCVGVVLFAGLAAVITGYAFPTAIIGGAALGAMLFHWPGEKRYDVFLQSLRS